MVTIASAENALKTLYLGVVSDNSTLRSILFLRK